MMLYGVGDKRWVCCGCEEVLMRLLKRLGNYAMSFGKKERVWEEKEVKKKERKEKRKRVEQKKKKRRKINWVCKCFRGLEFIEIYMGYVEIDICMMRWVGVGHFVMCCWDVGV